MVILLITAVLLSGCLTAAQEEHVCNFQVVNQNNTHATFSWDIVDGYYSSSDIDNFYLHFEYRSLYVSSLNIQYSETTRNDTTFMYTSSYEAFYSTYANYYSAELLMWIQVYRSSHLNPRRTYSERLYANFGQLETVFEFKVHLWPSQSCSDIIGTSTSNSYHYYYGYISVLELATKEVRWLLLQSCQCALPYYSTASVGYFTCAPSDYLVFRLKFTSPYYSSIDLNALKANLTAYIARNKGNALMTINGGGYFVSQGPCGLTVPYLYSPHCFNDSLDVEEAPTQPKSVMSTSDQDMMTSTSTAAPTTTNGSAQPAVIAEDNIAVVAIVSAMCSATMALVLGACILVLILFMRMKKRAPKETTLSRLYWHNGVTEDTPWVLSDANQVDGTSKQALITANKSAADKM